MGGIKGLIGLHFWFDNEKKHVIECMLSNQKEIPKERLTIIKDLKSKNRIKPIASSNGHNHKNNRH